MRPRRLWFCLTSRSLGRPLAADREGAQRPKRRYAWPVFDLFAAQSGILLVISIALFIVKGFALVDCVSRRESDFLHLETLPKRGWLILLGLAVVLHIVTWAAGPISLFNLAGTVVALVYLAQVRGSN